MSEWISVDELIEFCDTERSMLNAHNGGNSVACAALRRVVDFVKEYAVETEPNKSWVSVNDRLPEEDENVLTYGARPFYDVVCVNRLIDKKNGEWLYDGVTHWMPLPEKPESEDDEE